MQLGNSKMIAQSLNLRLHIDDSPKGYSLVHSDTGFVIFDRIRFLGIAEKLLLEIENEDWRFFTPESPKLTRAMEKVANSFRNIARIPR